MPDELATKLHELDLLAVQRADHLGPPVFMNQSEFVCEVDLVHARALRRGINCCSQARRDCCHRLLGGDNGNNLEIGDVVPVADPLIEEATILALHYLTAAAQVLSDPAATIRNPVWHQASTIAEPLVHRHRVPVTKGFDDHVQHGASCFDCESSCELLLASRHGQLDMIELEDLSHMS